jgi:hypothetical protein
MMVNWAHFSADFSLCVKAFFEHCDFGNAFMVRECSTQRLALQFVYTRRGIEGNQPNFAAVVVLEMLREFCRRAAPLLSH